MTSFDIIYIVEFYYQNKQYKARTDNIISLPDKKTKIRRIVLRNAYELLCRKHKAKRVQIASRVRNTKCKRRIIFYQLAKKMAVGLDLVCSDVV
jgi:hypothetical protein